MTSSAMLVQSKFRAHGALRKLLSTCCIWFVVSVLLSASSTMHGGRGASTGTHHPHVSRASLSHNNTLQRLLCSSTTSIFSDDFEEVEQMQLVRPPQSRAGGDIDLSLPAFQPGGMLHDHVCAGAQNILKDVLEDGDCWRNPT